jgi:hypothetical protein
MYSTKTAIESTGSVFMNAGINDNVTLSNVEVAKSPTGKDFIRFTFSDADGKTAEMTEWKNEKSMYVKTDAELQKEDDRQFGRIMQIIKCYISEVPDVELNSFIDMINWVKTTLNGVNKDTKLRLKVVYDNKGFIRVSKNGIFVEPMTVQESRIVLTGRDKTIRPDIPVDKEETPKIDPLSAVNDATPADETNSDDDLPF